MAIDLPVDLVPHRHERAIFGTSADGRRWVYVRHLPSDELIRVAGQTKDALIGRGWEIAGERHYDKAIEVRSVKRAGRARRARVTWVIARAGRVLLCETGGRGVTEAELAPSARGLCQAVEVQPTSAPTTSPGDAGP